MIGCLLRGLAGVLAVPYPKYAITSIDILATSDPDRVEFHALLSNSNETAVILTDIQDTGRTVRGGGWFNRRQNPVFSARVVPRIEEVESQHTLLCMHGFNTQPQDWLRACAEYSGNSTIIPLMWAATEDLAYFEDRSEAVESALAFRSLLETCIGIKGPKSLMCHSMGNYILRNAAPIGTACRLMENIYMVAADVNSTIFSTQSGVSIQKLGRRVHVLYSRGDRALLFRQSVLRRTFGRRRVPALGFAGAPDGVNVTNVDCRGFSNRNDVLGHSYYFKPEAVDYYENGKIP